jgi:hypothetical protein
MPHAASDSGLHGFILSVEFGGQRNVNKVVRVVNWQKSHSVSSVRANVLLGGFGFGLCCHSLAINSTAAAQMWYAPTIAKTPTVTAIIATIVSDRLSALLAR